MNNLQTTEKEECREPVTYTRCILDTLPTKDAKDDKKDYVVPLEHYHVLIDMIVEKVRNKEYKKGPSDTSVVLFTHKEIFRQFGYHEHYFIKDKLEYLFLQKSEFTKKITCYNVLDNPMTGKQCLMNCALTLMGVLPALISIYVNRGLYIHISSHY
jgi:hypothetical protein